MFFLLFMMFESAFFANLPMGLVVSLSFFSFILPLLSMVYVKYGTMLFMKHLSEKLYSSLIFLCSFFLLILLVNLYGMVPYSFPMTSMPWITLSMGVLFWASGYFMVLFGNYSSCLAHFMPLGAPMYLSVFLVWIEIISWLCRPLALGIRLMANITSGHLLLSLVGGGVYQLSYLFFMPFIFLIMLTFLEISVAGIQAYVYNLLLGLYMSESLE